jgi:hypothetical protein
MFPQDLPDGVFFQTDTKDPTQGVRYHLSGSTAGQSSLFQSLDIILGVNHPGGRERFVEDMRKGMPCRSLHYRCHAATK